MHELVVIDVPGIFLGKTGERMVARRGREFVGETPLDHVETLLVEGRGITISSDLVHSCAERGIQINFTDSRGEPVATLASPAFGATIRTRRAQLSAFDDARGFLAARCFVTAKLRNQANLLKYFGKYRRIREPQVFSALARAAATLDGLSDEARLVTGSSIDEARPNLMNVEGRAGAVYWNAVAVLLGSGFTKRDHRDAEDPINQALNYGYGILYGVVYRAVTLAGLDPFGGFLHVDRPGKPSLVLDLIEEFRQPVVDRPIIAGVGRGASFTQDDGKLSRESRRMLVQLISERLQVRELLRDDKERLTMSAIITRQARRLASFLRGESSYVPYVSRW
jgi:CRISPR-associated protein Cas1